MRALAPSLCRVIVIMALLVMPAGIMAQDTEDSDQDYKFSTEELTQMLAPIALYPDALTAQVLMASTYPLEVVEAERWRSRNLQLQGNDLDTALQGKSWDPSVKSLCHFPDLLTSMSDKLDQTRKLGDAFLGQEDNHTDPADQRHEPQQLPPSAAAGVVQAAGSDRDRGQHGGKAEQTAHHGAHH